MPLLREGCRKQCTLLVGTSILMYKYTHTSWVFLLVWSESFAWCCFCEVKILQVTISTVPYFCLGKIVPLHPGPGRGKNFGIDTNSLQRCWMHSHYNLTRWCEVACYFGKLKQSYYIWPHSKRESGGNPTVNLDGWILLNSDSLEPKVQNRMWLGVIKPLTALSGQNLTPVDIGE